MKKGEYPMKRDKGRVDNLSKCMIQCEKDGYGVRYGAWRAAQGDVLIFTGSGIPEGWRKCKHCGKPFKPYNNQQYCEVRCQYLASRERERKRKFERNSSEEAVAGDTEAMGE